MKIKILSILFLLILTINHWPLTIANAQTMSNSDYMLEQSKLNSFSGTSANSSYNINSTGGGLAPGVYSGTNYKIRANFSYGAVATSSSAFTFSLTNNLEFLVGGQLFFGKKGSLYVDYGTLLYLRLKWSF